MYIYIYIYTFIEVVLSMFPMNLKNHRSYIVPQNQQVNKQNHHLYSSCCRNPTPFVVLFFAFPVILFLYESANLSVCT